VSTLERHCQLLLSAYPAAYREARGEEMIGTLLEATPPGRSWPLLRDVRCLIFGGLWARAAFNRQLTTAANLRIAVLAGVAAYLALSSAGSLSLDVEAEIGLAGRILPAPFSWPMLLASALILLTVGMAWLSGRRAVVLAAAVPAAAATCYAGPWNPDVAGPVTHLALLAALVALAGGSRRPSRRWLVPVGVLAILPLIPGIGLPQGPVLYALLQAVGAVSIVWAVIDARPAIAVIVVVLAFWLPIGVSNLMLGSITGFASPYPVIAIVNAVPALWLLRRQSARPGRPAQA